MISFGWHTLCWWIFWMKGISWARKCPRWIVLVMPTNLASSASWIHACRGTAIFRIGEVVSRLWWLWVQGFRCQIGHKERPISFSQQYCALLLTDLLECIGMPNCRDPTTEPLSRAISNEIWQGNDLLRVGHLCWWIFEWTGTIDHANARAELCCSYQFALATSASWIHA